MGLWVCPVKEIWGQGTSITPEHRALVESVVFQIAEKCGSKFDSTEYGEVTVWWIELGEKFLNQLAQLDLAAFPTIWEDIRMMQQWSETWKESLDPSDGSLRFYVD